MVHAAGQVQDEVILERDGRFTYIHAEATYNDTYVCIHVGVLLVALIGAMSTACTHMHCHGQNEDRV
jgi:hypothetical protein